MITRIHSFTYATIAQMSWQMQYYDRIGSLKYNKYILPKI